MPILATFIQHSVGNSSTGIRQKKKEEKEVQMRKEEVNLSLTVENMISSVENPNDVTKNLLELNGKLVKAEEY